ncbi:MAG: hypothetical protein QOJ85_2922, partial [Solirubrobacteraceae bacterium]|nr:hypothetical protein [Solirubrobacteraceae bacterium]
MNRSSLKYLVIGLLIGGLATSAIDASALVSPGSGSTTSAGAAAVHKKKPKKKKKAKKKKAPVPAPAPSATAAPLVGLFRFTPGAYSAGVATGSYIRLVLAGGTKEKGPFFPNPSSKATTYTL